MVARQSIAAKLLEQRLKKEAARRRRIEQIFLPPTVEKALPPLPSGRPAAVEKALPPRLVRRPEKALPPRITPGSWAAQPMAAVQPAMVARIGGLPPMGSSVVQFLEYLPEHLVVNVRLGLGRGSVRDYHYTGVPQSVFDDWWEGKATCKTTDRHSRKLWRAGDTPSLGAFYNQHIKGRYLIQSGFKHTSNYTGRSASWQTQTTI